MNQVKPFQEQGKHTEMHNVAFDEIMPRVSANAWKVLCLIIRCTRGWHKRSDEISYSQIKIGTGIKSDTTVSAALKELLEGAAFGCPVIARRMGQRSGAASHCATTYGLNRGFCVALPPENDAPENEAHTSKNGVLNASNFEVLDTPKNEASTLQKMERQKERKKVNTPPPPAHVEKTLIESNASPPEMPPSPPSGLPSDVAVGHDDFRALQEITGRMWGVGPPKMSAELVSAIRLLRVEDAPPATPPNLQLFAERWKLLGRTKPYPAQVAANWSAIMNPPKRPENPNHATDPRNSASPRHPSAAERSRDKWENKLEELGD